MAITPKILMLGDLGDTLADLFTASGTNTYLTTISIVNKTSANRHIHLYVRTVDLAEDVPLVSDPLILPSGDSFYLVELKGSLGQGDKLKGWCDLDNSVAVIVWGGEEF
jgi:hypothetical protein